MTGSDLGLIQGLVLRGYKHHRFARHFVLSVKGDSAARGLLGKLAVGDPDSQLKITTAAWWNVRPPFTLNIAITCAGLQGLKVPDADLRNFPGEFQQGAVKRAPVIFDVGDSAPSAWHGNMGDESKVQVIVSLFAISPPVLEEKTRALRVLLQPGFEENYFHDGAALPGGYVHFGYKDGISQPQIDGVEKRSQPYPLPSSPAGDFVLGYTNSFGTLYSPALANSVLGRNGSFAAFRILMQDVAGFESFLTQAAPQAGFTVEMLAAKLMGRWRSGAPLELAPTADSKVPFDRMNYFLFTAATDGQPQADTQGAICPIGSHIRRGNPRDQTVAGGSSQQSRILRHNLPYGPAFDPARPDDGIERGLVGYFINASFSVQFELLMSQWLNTNGFTSGCITGLDPLIGDNDPATSGFSVPTVDSPGRPQQCGALKPIRIKSFARFVNTRGSAYCFLPSIPALQYIAALA
jgi:deferrochelatase/peroxidase EfeB